MNKNKVKYKIIREGLIVGLVELGRVIFFPSNIPLIFSHRKIGGDIMPGVSQSVSQMLKNTIR